MSLLRDVEDLQRHAEEDQEAVGSLQAAAAAAAAREQSLLADLHALQERQAPALITSHEGQLLHETASLRQELASSQQALEKAWSRGTEATRELEHLQPQLHQQLSGEAREAALPHEVQGSTASAFDSASEFGVQAPDNHRYFSIADENSPRSLNWLKGVVVSTSKKALKLPRPGRQSAVSPDRCLSTHQ